MALAVSVDRPPCEATSPRFRLERLPAGPRTQIVAAGGRVAFLEARQLERETLDGIRQGRTHVVIDLRDVTEIGPGLLGALLRIRRGVTRVGGRLALVVVDPPVSELVHVTVLSALMDVAPDREQALPRVSPTHDDH